MISFDSPYPLVGVSGRGNGQTLALVGVVVGSMSGGYIACDTIEKPPYINIFAQECRNLIIVFDANASNVSVQITLNNCRGTQGQSFPSGVVTSGQVYLKDCHEISYYGDGLNLSLKAQRSKILAAP